MESSRPVLKSILSCKSSPRGSPSFRRQNSSPTFRMEGRINGFNTKCFRSYRMVLWLLLITLWAYAGFCIQSWWAHDDIFWGDDEIEKSFELSVSNVAVTDDDVKINANQSDVKKMDIGIETNTSRDVLHNVVSVKKRSKRSRRGSSSRTKHGNKKKVLETQNINDVGVQGEQIPQTNATYGMLVGPFGSIEDRVMDWSPVKISGTCDKKSQFARLVWSRKFVLIFHELSMTGAPLSMMELASEILSCGGTVSVVALSRKGGLLPELSRKKIKVLEDKDKLSFKAAMKADLVIAGSAVCASWIEQYLDHSVAGTRHLVWWIMENRREYFDRSKLILNRVKTLIFLSESQAKQWMAWCEDENIKFKTAPSLVPLSVNDELAFVAGISCSLNTPALTTETMLEKRLLLRKLVREEMGVKDNDMLVMALSSINPGKGHLLLLKSVHLATNIKPGGLINNDIKLLIGSVGSKSNKVIYVKSLFDFLSNHSDLQSSIIWTPATTRAASLYSAADVYVINSQGIGETFGRVTIEAMAYGIPVLGTDAGGTKEIVIHNVSGLLHPTGHSGTTLLSKHLQYLLKNPSERQRLGLEGREKRLVDNFLAVTKESVKTITYETLSNIVRLINGISAVLLSILPGKANILEGIQGWELRPKVRGPRFPRWMEDGVSSFNSFVHELSVDLDSISSGVEHPSEDDMDDHDDIPSTPLTPNLIFSRATSFAKRERKRRHWIISIIMFLLIPARLMFGIPFYVCKRIFNKGVRSHTSNHRRVSSANTTKKALDHVVQRATDRRRGIIEDLHLGIEIVIETIFDVIHHVTHCLLSPLESLRKLLRWSCSSSSSPSSSNDTTKIDGDNPDAIVPTTTLAKSDPTPTQKKTTLSGALNTDARTCRDVITELGYPYEAIDVVTKDGYVLLLERIPRRDSKKAVYLQHGVFDSSMCWVSNGIVGSPAFAAFDHGYDVFLGNFRGRVSKKHINKKLSSRQYWRYSINEHGTQDLPALIEKINEVKTSELKSSSQTEESNPDQQPYKLCGICHSLGGAAFLMYIITRRVENKPHRLSRTIMLSPAGFHHDSPFFFTVIEYSCLWLSPVLSPICPGLYVPTRFFRMLINKLARDLQNYPAVGGLVQTIMGYLVGGDCSNWVGVMGLPHYNMNDMPGVSFGVARHLAQIKHAKRFVMFDYGSREANMKVYGSPEPMDLGERYNLIDIPIDLVAGMKDKVILPSMIIHHYRLMKDAGVSASYKQFEYAHLDFTFSHREELLEYVMSRLLLVESKHRSSLRLKLKRKDEILSVN